VKRDGFAPFDTVLTPRRVRKSVDSQNAQADRPHEIRAATAGRAVLRHLTLPPRAAGQAASATLTQGVRAYDDLEFEQGCGIAAPRARRSRPRCAFRRRQVARAGLPHGDELLRDRRDSARAIARRLVLSNPRFRPDELVFPPQLLLLYEVVRRATPAVIGEAAADTAIRPGSEAWR